MRVLIRADGDRAIGTGHVMRMLALAERLLDRGGQAVFAAARLDPALQHRLTAHGFEMVTRAVEPGSPGDLDWTLAVAAEGGFDWIAVDGHAFGAAWQSGLRAAGAPVLFADDEGRCSEYTADLVLNHGLHARASAYEPRHPRTRLLLGPRHALIRKALAAGPPAPLPGPEARRVLVTMGGSDPVDATSRVLQGLRMLPGDLQVEVVVGPCNPHRTGLAAAAAADPRVHLLDSPADLVARMRGADLAIAAGGGTTWELCCLGVPSALLAVAGNQVPVVEAMARSDAAEDLGWHADLQPARLADRVHRLLADVERRRALHRAGRELVDGRGAERVLEAMQGA